MSDLDPRLAEAIKKVTGKRPRTVIQHILEHGSVSTEVLKDQYGYDHPPRAARDVREAGIPLETFKVKDSNGKSIGAYRFGNPDDIENHKLAGRRTFSKDLKQSLLEAAESKCAICQTRYEGRYLQIDHKVPYEVVGDSEELKEESLMLVCGSCQRGKSWTCERCSNWNKERSSSYCEECYWANPGCHEHIAGDSIRRLDITWVAEEVTEFAKLTEMASTLQMKVADLVKHLLRQAIDEE